jgi:hypothetical protein
MAVLSRHHSIIPVDRLRLFDDDGKTVATLVIMVMSRRCATEGTWQQACMNFSGL